MSVDLSARTIVEAAMLLTDIQHAQRRRGALPLFIVPPDSHAAQRLLVTSQLTGIVVSGAAPAERIARWLRLPLRIGAGLVWLGLMPPLAPARSPHLVPLLPALAYAGSVVQAAGWCALSGRRAYDILADAAEGLALPALPWRQPRRWAAALCAGLARPPIPRETAQANQEDQLGSPRLERIAATLCGCRIERYRSSARQVSFELDEPHLGRLSLACAGAELLELPPAWSAFAELADWRRTVSWVEIVGGDSLALHLADDEVLRLRLGDRPVAPTLTSG